MQRVARPGWPECGTSAQGAEKRRFNQRLLVWAELCDGHWGPDSAPWASAFPFHRWESELGLQVGVAGGHVGRIPALERPEPERSESGVKPRMVLHLLLLGGETSMWSINDQ